MTDRLMRMSCEDFADELAAKKPVPGGGGVAALVGALGAALCSMVGNYTVGKVGYSAVEADMQSLLLRAGTVRARLLDLVDEDACAFEPLSHAYGIPKDDPERVPVLEAAAMSACHAPVAMMHQICVAIELLEEMGKKGSAMLLSDVACGAYLCRASLEAAAVNVYVNTAMLQDRTYAWSIEAECDNLLAEYRVRAERVASRVVEGIRERSQK